MVMDNASFFKGKYQKNHKVYILLNKFHNFPELSEFKKIDSCQQQACMLH